MNNTLKHIIDRQMSSKRYGKRTRQVAYLIAMEFADALQLQIEQPKKVEINKSFDIEKAIEVINSVMKYDLRENSRKREVCDGKKMLSVLMKKAGHHENFISNIINRDRTQVLYNINEHKHLLITSLAYRNAFNIITEKLIKHEDTRI